MAGGEREGAGVPAAADDTIERALERVVSAARAHLAAVRSADGRIDDGAVWQAYVELNNASHAYDAQLLEAFGEVTPWDVDALGPDGDAATHPTDGGPTGESADPYPRVLSVRQRRDFRVPSVGALLAAARRARGEAQRLDGGAGDGPLTSVVDAVLELLQVGDGSLAALDVAELDPCDGLVTVVEVDRPLAADDFPDDDAAGAFALADGDRLVGRLDEHPFLDE